MIRTRVVWTGVAGTPYYSTFYWAGSGPTIAQDAQLATIDWVSQWASALNDELSAQVESEVLEINEATGVIVTLHDVAGSTTQMTNPGEPLPYQVQALTFFGTTSFINGRRLRGRSFLPGLSEGANVSGAGPLEVLREQVQSAYVNTIGGATAQHVVWSRTNGQIAPVTSYQTSPTWSTLRSRRA